MEDFLPPPPGADFTLEDLVGSPTSTVKAPEATLRNRAASYASLTDNPDTMVEDYRAMLAESQVGQDMVRSQIEAKAVDQVARSKRAALMGILADPKLDIDQKRAALGKASVEKINPVEVLTTNSVAAPNPGENADQENARISIADSLDELVKSREQMQGIVNAHALSLPLQEHGETLAQAIEAWMVPFTTSKTIAGIVADYREKTGQPMNFIEFLKAAVLPGSAKVKIMEELNAMPPAQRAKMLNDLRGIISNNSSLVLPENNFNKMILGQELLSGNPEDVSTTMDNLTPLFDVLALGGLWREAKSFLAADKTAPEASKAAQVAEGTVPTVTTPTSPSKAPVVGEKDLAKMPTPPATRGTQEVENKIAALQEQRAELLGGSSGLLPRGSVKKLEEELANLAAPSKDTKQLAKQIQKEKGSSYKNALGQAEKAVSDAEAEYQATRLRLQQQLQANAEAAKNEQRLADLDKQIQSLQKNLEVVPNTAKNDLADAISRIGLRSDAAPYHPIAPGNILSFGNPTKARALHAALVMEPSDELAKAMFGVNKMDAIAGNVMPQVTTKEGVVLAKTPDIERTLRAGVDVDPAILETLKKGGALNFTQSERAAARADVMNDFRNASGLTINDAMSSFAVEGDKIKIGAVYGSTEGGFHDAATAAQSAIASLRKFGIGPENLTLLGRKGDEFIPLDSKAVDTSLGEYYVRVDHSEEIAAAYAKDQDWSSKWNFFDRYEGFVNTNSGSLTRHLFTSGMVIDPKFTSGASRVSDYTAKLEKVMLELANDFAEQHNALTKAQQGQLDTYLREANFNELPLDHADLMARGFTADMIQAASSWRRYWDNNYFLENLDMVRSLRNEGFQYFKGSNGTELFVKPIEKNLNAANVYDSTVDQVVKLSRQEMDDLYNQGGTFARLRRPTDINGVHVEHVVVRNNMNEYARAVTENDKVLNYKNGYYQIQYQAPRFVDEYKEVNGVMQRKAIAVAGDSYEAETFAKRMRNNNPNNAYKVRGDDRVMARSGDDWWDLQEASGRIAQRHRGQLLQDSSGLNHLGDTDFILDPVTSAIRAARSVSGRTIGRPYLESAKARVMAKYSHVMPTHPTTHQPRWPTKLGEIGEKGGQFGDDVKNARTMFEYINYLENGYVNGMDNAVKGMLNVTAAWMGEKAIKGNKIAAKAERALGSISTLARPASLAKNAIFTNFIALNPFRQWVVQPHQALRMWAYDPVAASHVYQNLAQYASVAWGNASTASKEAKAFHSFAEESGLLSAVDKHNMVRGALVDAANNTNAIGKALEKVTSIPRKLGFDAGEQANQLMHLSAVYNRYKRQGKNLADSVVREEAYAEARALSYSMNFAGDMPYNQNSMGFLLQFLQIPHKALAQLFDRQLALTDRMKLLAADTLMFGAPTAMISEAMGGDILPDDPKLREILTAGMEQWAMNKMFTQFTGKDVKIDFTSLSPYDMSGWTDFFKAIWSEGGIEALISNSPTGNLFFEQTGKVQNLMRSVMRMMGVVEDPMELTDIKQVGLDAARLLGGSGWTNAEKALFMIEHQKRLSSKGVVMDDEVGHLEAVAQLLGFGSYDAKLMAQLSMESYDIKKRNEDKWNRDYDIMMKYYTDTLSAGNQDWNKISAVTGHIMSVYKDDFAAQEYFMKRLSSDVGAGESNANRVLRQVMMLSGYKDPQQSKDLVRQSTLKDEDKKKVLDMIDYLTSMRGDE